MAAVMSSRFPYIVIDQNQMRNEDAIMPLLDRCCRDSLFVLIPDVAGFEILERHMSAGYVEGVATRTRAISGADLCVTQTYHHDG